MPPYSHRCVLRVCSLIRVTDPVKCTLLLAVLHACGAAPPIDTPAFGFPRLRARHVVPKPRLVLLDRLCEMIGVEDRLGRTVLYHLLAAAGVCCRCAEGAVESGRHYRALVDAVRAL